MSLPVPERGFVDSEFEARTAQAQARMATAGISALLLTTEPEVRYFSGFMTPFWQSPTRPWFLIVPLCGKPIAVIPEIGAERMATTWVEDIRVWPAPRPTDDGIALLSDLLSGLTRDGGTVGLPMGHESLLRMPLTDFHALRVKLSGTEFVDASPIVQGLRMIKSEVEIEKTRYICQLVSDGFESLETLAKIGDVEREIFRAVRIDFLTRGADEVPYLVGGSGPGGPIEVIGPPSGRILAPGDVLMLDTGTVFDGYYSDFDRNFAFGFASDATRRAYDVVFRATEAGLASARPGATAADLWAAMAAVLDVGGSTGNAVGRLGHGLGTQLTEQPSNMPGDETMMVPGMVMTLEPGMTYGDGRVMVHEENIVIRDGPPELLSRRASVEIPIIE
ncbi:MAG: Xaa-Pro peptidase family protein [Alphaproteobacteria bacterium]|nr:Xaa-Pro peptidase family protein [Alphaproteobacteria bacterium]